MFGAGIILTAVVFLLIIPIAISSAIIPDIVEFIKNWQGPVVFTRDTHVDGIYENSLEGKYLPADKGLKHCIHGTDGWMVRQDVANAAGAKFQAVIDKPTFGYTDWNNEGLQRIIAQAEEIVLNEIIYV